MDCPLHLKLQVFKWVQVWGLRWLLQNVDFVAISLWILCVLGVIFLLKDPLVAKCQPPGRGNIGKVLMSMIFVILIFTLLLKHTKITDMNTDINNWMRNTQRSSTKANQKCPWGHGELVVVCPSGTPI
jgi:hypothetical protein